MIMMQKTGTDQNINLTEKVRDVIDQQLRRRLRRLDADVELISVSDGTVRVGIKKNKATLFNIRKEVLEKMVITEIKLSIPGIREVRVTW